MSATSRSSAGVGAGPGRTRRARSRKTATEGTARVLRGGAGARAAPAGRRTPRPRRAARGWWRAPTAAGTRTGARSTVSRAASSRCSQLSTTSSPGRSPSTATQAARTSPCDDVQVQRRRQRVRDRGRVGDRGEQQHGRRLAARRDLQRDPGLADAARADDRDHPLRGEQPVQRRDLRLAAEEPGSSARAPAAGAAARRPATSRSTSPSGGDGSRPVSSAPAPAVLPPIRSASGACPVAASTQQGGYAQARRTARPRSGRLPAEAGFTWFRRAAETPFNLVYKIRP